MIKVKQLSDHLFAVDFSGDQLLLIQDAAAETPYTQSEVLFSLLLSVLRVDDKNILPERNRNELDRKDERVGRG